LKVVILDSLFGYVSRIVHTLKITICLQRIIPIIEILWKIKALIDASFVDAFRAKYWNLEKLLIFKWSSRKYRCIQYMMILEFECYWGLSVLKIRIVHIMTYFISYLDVISYLSNTLKHSMLSLFSWKLFFLLLINFLYWSEKNSNANHCI
jgi:hypothetical protein